MASLSSLSTTSLDDHRQHDWPEHHGRRRLSTRRQLIVERKILRQMTTQLLARTISRESLTLQLTEADVCFPLTREHPHIDFNVLDSFIAEERQCNVKPVASRTSSKYLPLSESLHLNNLPTRFSFMQGDNDTTHSHDLSGLVPEGKLFKLLFAPGSSAPWWLDCSCPNDDEMKTIARAFGIHPLTAEDIRTQELREKVELFRHYYFVCFHTFDQDQELQEYLEPINFYIVVFAEGVLSFHYSPAPHPVLVRRRIRQLSDYVNVLADWICYALIDDIVDAFVPVIDAIEYEADAIEDAVFELRDVDFAKMLERIGELRRKVMLLMRLLSNKADVIKMFAKRYQEKQHFWHQDQLTMHRGEIALYLGDIQDHVLTMFQNLNSYEKIFSRSHSNYLAQLQVMSFNANKRINELFSQITLIGTILVPLNLVTGLFGMNVTVPGEATGLLNWWFGIMAVLIAIMLVSFIGGLYWLNTGVDTLGQPEPTHRRIMRRGLGAEVKLIILLWTNDD